MKGKLNLFQATMLRWRDLHPYSAVHAVHVGSPLDGDRLASTIAAALEQAGLTGLALDQAHARYHFDGGPARVSLRTVTGSGELRADLAREFEYEINTPFGSGETLDPFRFFAIRGSGCFVLGLAYDHFIAGGDSIVALLRRIVEAYGAAADSELPVKRWSLYPRTYSRLFLRRAGSLIAGLSSLPRLIGNSRHAHRPGRFSAGDARNGVLLFSIAAADAARIRDAARSWGVTLNDIFLAAALIALAPLTPERADSRRHRVAVASIMNIRRELAPPADDSFGQFLGSLQVAHPVPCGISLKQLAREVHQQTSMIKRKRLYLQTLLALAVNGFVWRFLSLEQRHGFYAKHYPVWAGITMLNVDAQWSCPPNADGFSYARVASTGPLAPMVLAVTAAGDDLEVGISYRAGVIPPAKLEAMVTGFKQCVQAFAL
jgi:hypothetical protein